MNKELTTTQNKMSITEVMDMAKIFAESGMFTDAKQMAQAFVKIQAGNEFGIAPFQSMTGIHIIQGKPEVGAGLIASKVRNSGKYDYAIKEHTNRICSIDFFKDGKFEGNSTFTFEDAVKADTKNMAKFPRNMLFARAMSNGQKWFAPDVFVGPVYVSGELGGETLDIDHTVMPEAPIEQEDYTNSLKEAGSLEDLQAAWSLIPVSEKKKYEGVKEECKNSLSAQSEPIEDAVIIPDEKEADEWEEKIKDCKTVAELTKVWKEMGKTLQPKYELLKDIQKQEISQAK